MSDIFVKSPKVNLLRNVCSKMSFLGWSTLISFLTLKNFTQVKNFCSSTGHLHFILTKVSSAGDHQFEIVCLSFFVTLEM